MRYEAMKQTMMRQFPSLFPTEDHVLHHLFFVCGTGIYWENGELANMFSYEDDALIFERYERRMKREELWARIRTIWFRYTDWDDIAIPVDDDWPETPITGAAGPIKTIYPYWESANICHVPANVKPDWMNAAVRAREMEIRISGSIHLR